jgi:hypothetical protein
MENTNVQPIIMNGVTVGHYNAGPKTNPWTINKNIQYSDVDLLAVSANLYRRFKNEPENRYTDLFQAAKFTNITTEDHELAEKIALYFSKQIVMAQLRGDVTEFQRTAGAFISSNRLTLEYCEVGLIYRLPEYYEADKKFIAMRDICFREHEHVDVTDDFYVRKLIPIETIAHDTRNAKLTEYWFSDVETNNPVMLTVGTKAELKYLWDRIFKSTRDNQDTISVSGVFQTRKHRLNMQYLHSTNWKLEP